MQSIQKQHNQSGQVAIVILLIMVVLLTVGLSLASRTTQELFLSQQEAESARVFNAAEVGVEDALTYDFDSITGTGEIQITDPQAVEDVLTDITIQPANTLETQIVEGAAVHLNLTGTTSSNFIVHWGRTAEACNAASLLVSTYYDDNGTAKVIHEAFGPCTRTPDDAFTIIGVTDSSNGYYKQKTVTLPSGMGITPQFARIRAVYSDTALRVTGTGLTQSFAIRSAASTQVGEESRTVEVARTLSGAPSYMDYALYSGAGITQDAP